MQFCQLRCSLNSSTAFSLVLGLHRLRPQFQVTLHFCFDLLAIKHMLKQFTIDLQMSVKCPQKPTYFNFVLPRQTQLLEGQKGKEDSTMEDIYFKPMLSCYQGLSKYRVVHCKHP